MLDLLAMDNTNQRTRNVLLNVEQDIMIGK